MSPLKSLGTPARLLLTGLCGFLLVSGCQNQQPATSTAAASTNSSLLTTWLALSAEAMQRPELARHPEHFRLQLLLTEIRHGPDGQIVLTEHQYRSDAEYLYPASTVKLAIAALALEYLQQFSAFGVTADSVMQTEPLLAGDLWVNRDESAASGAPSVRHYVKKILLISDNDAYNRLYELLGQQHINARLAELGFNHAQILHRLERPLSAADNRATNAIGFYTPDGHLLYRQPARVAPVMAARPYTPVGNDYQKDGVLAGQPLDFSQKNRWSLSDMHRLTRLIMLPDSVPATARLRLSPANLQFLQQQMAQTPPESQDPRYDPALYWPAYVKFLLYGAAKDVQLDPRVHIHNKVGDAYGFLLDSAYVKDDCSGAEFLLSAGLYVNQDGVLNDDHYDYDSIGLPLLKRLGEHALAHARVETQAKGQCLPAISPTSAAAAHR